MHITFICIGMPTVNLSYDFINYIIDNLVTHIAKTDIFSIEVVNDNCTIN